MERGEREASRMPAMRGLIAPQRRCPVRPRSAVSYSRVGYFKVANGDVGRRMAFYLA